MHELVELVAVVLALSCKDVDVVDDLLEDAHLDVEILLPNAL